MASTESGSIRQKVENGGNEWNEWTQAQGLKNHEILGNKNSIHLWIAGTLKISKSVVFLEVWPFQDQIDDGEITKDHLMRFRIE